MTAKKKPTTSPRKRMSAAAKAAITETVADAARVLKENDEVEVAPSGLNERQQRFVLSYIQHLNASRAAREAGYSERTAGQTGYDLLRHPQIAEAISIANANRAAKLEVTAERVLLELARLAFFDAGKLYDADGNPVPITSLDEDTRRAIVGVKNVVKGNADMGFGEVQEVKAADKKGALELLSRHLGLLQDNVNLKGKLEVDPSAALLDYLKPGSRLPVKE